MNGKSHNNILLLSVVVLGCGIVLSLFSYLPKTIQIPYLRTVQQPVETVQQDGVTSNFYTYYSKSFQCKVGDTIQIRSQSQTAGATLSATVSELLGNTVMQQNDVSSIDTTVTIPEDGYYSVVIERYRTSAWVIFLTQTNAYVYVKTSITETKTVQDYRPVTTYPYKDLITPAIAIMVAGIGIGVVSIAKKKSE